MSKHVSIGFYVLLSVKYLQQNVLLILLYKTKTLHIPTTLGVETNSCRADHPSLTPPFGKKCYIMRKKVDSPRDSCFFSGRRGGV